MRWMAGRTRLTIFTLAVATAFVGAGCSNPNDGGDKAGGAGGPLVLRIADTSSDLSHQPSVQYFAERVEELSDGQLRIEPVEEWADFAPDAEQQVVNDVAAGEVDLGWVGSRVFDTMGVTSFQALTAPMLIDSYSLQNAVIKSGITDEMMQGLEDVGVVGLGVVPDALRKPVAVDRPFVRPADWRGTTFGTLMSNSQAEAIRALGATPAEVFGHERAEALEKGTIDGFEYGLTNYQRNPEWLKFAPYVTANVNLWPQMDVLLVEPSLYDELSDEQQEWLHHAAQEAADQSTAMAEADAESIGMACEGGARFADASNANLKALEKAFAPVYAELKQDPATKDFIARIQELKQSTSAEAALAIPAGCTGEAPAQQPDKAAGKAPAYLNGTYRYVLTQEDADKVGDTDEGYPIVNTITLKDGEMTGGCFVAGTYSVIDARITFHSDEYDSYLTVTFARDDEGNLTLTPVPPMDPGDAFQCFSKVWRKIG